MKLIGNLKNQVEKANSKEEAKGMIEKAGMTLNEDELEAVTGGMTNFLASRGPYDMDQKLADGYREEQGLSDKLAEYEKVLKGIGRIVWD